MKTQVIQNRLSNAFLVAIFAAVTLILGAVGMAAAQENINNAASSDRSAAQKIVIYVSDFAVDETNAGTQQESGSAAGNNKRTARAQKLVQVMSKSLVAELNKAGFRASGLNPGEKPSAGLLLTGTFRQLEPGSKMRRAFIGFGSGAAHVDVTAKVVDVAQPETSLYEFSTSQSSGKKPGAIITPSPVIGGVKLALTKNAPEKTVKKGAHQIASELANQLNAAQTVASN